MKTYKAINTESILAAANLNKQTFIGFDGRVCGANAKALGVAELDTASGEYGSVITHGIALVLSGAAITAGAAVVSNASGKAVAATTFSATTPSGAVAVLSSGAQPAMTLAGSVMPQAINGYAMDAATDADQVIRVVLR